MPPFSPRAVFQLPLPALTPLTMFPVPPLRLAISAHGKLPEMAASSSQKALRLPVVRRTSHYLVVNGQGHHIEIGHGQRIVTLPHPERCLLRKRACASDPVRIAGCTFKVSGQRADSDIISHICTVGANSADDNGLTMVSYASSGGAHNHITWDGARFLDSPRTTFEATRRSDSTHSIIDDYNRIDFTGCVLAAGCSTISGCTFKGSGTNSAFSWGQSVEFNRVVGMTFTGNTVYRDRGALLNFPARPA